MLSACYVYRIKIDTYGDMMARQSFCESVVGVYTVHNGYCVVHMQVQN